ncbi:MAG: PAS domain S-box protein [Deltaproteobacteria bacterium]|nr:PAS domain S-box protein [Deltaproteobacteria bacterium]
MGSQPSHETLEHQVKELEKKLAAHQDREREFQENLEKYRTLFNKANDGIYLYEIGADGLPGMIIEVNERAGELLQYSREELLRMSVKDFVTAGRWKDIREFMKELQAKRHLTFEAARVRKDGKTVPIEISAQLYFQNDKPVVISIMRDITERKESQDRVHQSEARFREMFNNTHNGVAVYQAVKNGEDFLIIDFNKAAEHIERISRTDVVGRSILEAFPSVKDFGIFAVLQRVWKTGAPESFPLGLYQDERIAGWRDNYVYKLPSGEVVAIYSDETKRKQDEEKIRTLYAYQGVIREINEALLRIPNEVDLYRKICELLAGLDDVAFVWIGTAEEGGFEVKPIARAGFDAGYLSEVRITWDESQYGKGPSGMAIKTGNPFIINDIQTDDRYTPWRREAVKRGYASTIALPLIHQEEVIGVLNIYGGSKDCFKDEVLEFLREVAGDIAVGVKSLRMENELEQQYTATKRLLEGTVDAIDAMLGMRDPYTAGHERRVAELACAIAAEMETDPDEMETIRIAGRLHDIGKISVPAEILSKPGRLNATEFAIIKTHPQAGYDIIKSIDFPAPIATMVHQHHERSDGSGYPLGLSGENICFEARILAVADVVEAMASHRPYRPACGIEAALDEISQNQDILYDAAVVDACLRLFSTKGFRFPEP